MNSYMTDYKRRLVKNNLALQQLAKDVMEIDPLVTAYLHHDESHLNHYMVFFRGEEINSITFREAPYHWVGCGHSNHPGKDKSVDMPFESMDVLSTFKPVTSVINRQPDEYFKSREHYLKIYSFLKPYKP